MPFHPGPVSLYQIRMMLSKCNKRDTNNANGLKNGV